MPAIIGSRPSRRLESGWDDGTDFDVPAIRELFTQACPEGERMLWAWDIAAQNAQDASGAVSKAVGVWESDQELEDRQGALMALPDRQFLHLLSVEPASARMAEVDAITRAFRRNRLVVVPEPRERTGYCGCGRKIANPDHEVCYTCYKTGKR